MTEQIPSDAELAALIKPLWLKEQPSRVAQGIRAALSCDFDDPRYKQWVSDFIPDYVWNLIDIAAERGIKAERARIIAALRERAGMRDALSALADWLEETP